ncbi:MAG: transglutaminaseTgpA domain-containing protein [Candidatus Sumerlaeota bacterium]|nr:transglutaminaseTgpA domain-containing protein [Candidatus Sumerlaeota bacterium]
MGLRLALLLMIATQAQTMRLMTGFIVFPVVILIIGVLGLPGKIAIEVKPANQIRLGFALAVVFAIVAQTYSFGVMGSIAIALPYKYCVALAQWCLIAQAAYFFLKTKDGKPPLFLALVGCVGMIYVGNKTGYDVDRNWYMLCATVFGFALMAYVTLAASRKSAVTMSLSYRLIFTTLIFAALAIGFGVSRGLIAAETGVIRLYGELFYGSQKSAGFPLTANLGSIAEWKEDGAGTVALRVVSADMPGYMRGRAYYTYQKASWHGDAFNRRINPTPPGDASVPQINADENLFATALPAHNGAGALRTMEVWNEQETRNVILSPLNARFLSIEAPFLFSDSNGALQTGGGVEAGRYHVLAPKDTSAECDLTYKTFMEYLSLPDNLDPKITTLSRQIVAGCGTDRLKIAAIENYFHENYLYKLGITIPTGADSLNYFLLQRPPAHCEYFASGAAILLRLAGVPCRYVTGFVAAESNPLGGYWIARNRDAHAWVEALDNGRWVTVEATPSEGVPSDKTHPKSGVFSNLLDSITFAFKRMKAAIMAGAIQTALKLLAEILVACVLFLVTTTPGLAIAAALLAAGIFWLLRKLRRRPRMQTNASLAALHRILAMMDRRLAKHDLRREPDETIHQFAARIAQAAAKRPQTKELLIAASQWYRDYAAVRFQGLAASDDIANLKIVIERVLSI